MINLIIIHSFGVILFYLMENRFLTSYEKESGEI